MLDVLLQGYLSARVTCPGDDPQCQQATTFGILLGAVQLGGGLEAEPADTLILPEALSAATKDTLKLAIEDATQRGVTVRVIQDAQPFELNVQAAQELLDNVATARCTPRSFTCYTNETEFEVRTVYQNNTIIDPYRVTKGRTNLEWM